MWHPHCSFRESLGELVTHSAPKHCNSCIYIYITFHREHKASSESLISRCARWRVDGSRLSQVERDTCAPIGTGPSEKGKWLFPPLLPWRPKVGQHTDPFESQAASNSSSNPRHSNSVSPTRHSNGHPPLTIRPPSSAQGHPAAAEGARNDRPACILES